MAKDYYQILGVSKNATEQEIKRAYRNLARKHHPDVDKSAEAERKFKEINEAYQVLSDSNKKSAYDQFGDAAFGRGFGAGAGGTSWQRQPGGYYYRTSGFGPGDFSFNFGDFADPFDIFEIFFGSASPFGARTRLPRYILDLDFFEAVGGIEKEIVVDGQKTKIKIPAGVDDGSEIKFPRFYVICRVKPHAEFKRTGYDIYVDCEISFAQAALGDTIEVPTIDGSVRIRVPPGTQPGTQIRLRGRGVRRIHNSQRGNEYIRLKVTVPTKLSAEEKEILEKLR